jgi:hypothetical protein
MTAKKQEARSKNFAPFAGSFNFVSLSELLLSVLPVRVAVNVFCVRLKEAIPFFSFIERLLNGSR